MNAESGSEAHKIGYPKGISLLWEKGKIWVGGVGG